MNKLHWYLSLPSHNFCENFYDVLTHLGTHNKLTTCNQLPEESFHQYYYHFTKLQAQVYDIIDREVIDHFANGIKYKW